MVKFALHVAFLMIAAPALAECPANKVGEPGLRLIHVNPYISVLYKQTKEGLTEERVTIGTQGPKTAIAVYSHPLLIIKRTAGGEVLRAIYSRNFRDLNNLPKYKTWISDVYLSVNGKQQEHGTETLEFKNISKLSIGECVYEVWKIEEKFWIKGKEPILFTKYYSPKLNVVLRATWKFQNGQARMDTTYDKIATLQE